MVRFSGARVSLARCSAVLVLAFLVLFSFSAASHAAPPAATPLSLDAPYTATHNGSGTWYSFYLSKGQGVSLELGTHFNSGTVDCYLYDSRLNTGWGSITNAGPSYTPAVRTITFNAPATGTYYLNVSGNGVGQYDLTLHSAWYNPGITDSLGSFSSTLATAKYLVDGSYTFNTRATVNRHRLVVKKGAQVSVGITHNFSSGAAVIGLVNKFGVQFATFSYVGVGYQRSKTLSFTAPKDDVYFFIVYSNGGDIVGTYDLALTGAQPDADSDGDGLSDAAEYFHGSDPLTADTNQNGSSDYQDLVAGTSPTASRDISASELAGATSPSGALTLNLNEVVSAASTGTGAWYGIDLVKDQKVVFVVTTRFPSSTNAYLYSPTNQSSYLNTFSTQGDSGPFSASKNVDWYGYQAPASGRYYLYLPGSTTSPAGSYDLAVYGAWDNPGTVDSDRIARTPENAGWADRDRLFSSSRYSARYLSDGSYPFPTRARQALLRFHAEAGTPVSIAVTPSFASGIVTASLLDLNGYTLSGTTTGYLGNGYASKGTISYTPAASGDYFLYLISNGISYGSYSIASSGIMAPPEQDDHGNDLEHATVVSDNSQTPGRIQNQLYRPSFDEDLFRFTATSRGTYRIYTTGTFDTSCQVCDATGGSCLSDDDSGSYPNCLVERELSLGEVAFVRVKNELASGSYTLHVEPPQFTPAPAGPLMLTPLYPVLESDPSTVMQGGKITRYYRLSQDSLPGLSRSVENALFHYQTCSAPGACGAVLDALSNKDGVIGFETDWVEDAPGGTVHRFVQFVNADGTPDTSVANPPSFDVAVYARSLKDQITFTLGGGAGAGVALGVGAGAGPLEAELALAKVGMFGEIDLDATITLDTNDYGTQYSKRTLKAKDDVKLGLEVGIGGQVELKIQGGPNGSLLGQKVKLLTAEGHAKYSNRRSRNEEFPDFFSTSTDPVVKARAEQQAYGFTGRLFNVAVQKYQDGPYAPVVSGAVDYLLGQAGPQTDFRKESGYETKLGLDVSLSGPTVTTSVGKFRILGIDGKVAYTTKEAESLNPADPYTKNSIELSYTPFTQFKVFDYEAKIPLRRYLGDRATFNPTAKLTAGSGERFSGELTMKQGRADSLSLSLTTEMLQTEGDIPLFNNQGTVENRITVYTTDPQYAQTLLDNRIGVGTLASMGLVESIASSDLQLDRLPADLVATLDSTRSSTALGIVKPPLEYYNSLEASWLTEISLPFEVEVGLDVEAAVHLGVMRSSAQIEAKGVSTGYGNLQTEEYRLNDQVIAPKHKDIGDIAAVYGRRLSQALSALVDKVKGAIDTGKVVLGAMVDGGIEVAHKIGDTFNWLSYTVNVASTKNAKSGQRVLALAAPLPAGTGATALGSLAGTATTVGQSHFVSVSDPGGVDLPVFPAPLAVSLGYRLTDLSAAGLAVSDAARLRAYRWDSGSGAWVYLGGTVDTVAQSVQVEITSKGILILALDTLPPTISGFAASDSTGTPLITASLTDTLSGIDPNTLSLSIDGVPVVTAANWQSFFNKATGRLNYRPAAALTPGVHTALLAASDSAGNATQATLSFQTAAPPAGYTHTPVTGAPAGSPVTVSATLIGSGSLSRAWLAYRSDAAGTYSYQAMTGSGPTVTAIIPAADTNAKQMTYYLYLLDADGYGTYLPPTAPATGYSFPLIQGSSRAVTVALKGVGSGTVGAPGLSCAGGVCTGSYPAGTVLTLTPAADPSSVFAGWQGEGCSGTLPCTVTVERNLNLTAPFLVRPTQTMNLTVAGTGHGTVNSTPSGISCSSGSCSAEFPYNTPLTLTATPDHLSVFAGWDGSCSGQGSCSVTMTGLHSLSANFLPAPKGMIGSAGYPSLAAAFSAALSGDQIRSIDSPMPDVGLVLDAASFPGGDATLKGGYLPDYSGRSGLPTILQGPLKMRSGTLRVERFKVR